MAEYVNSKNGRKYSVMESFIELDYGSVDFENLDSVKYCLQGLVPGSDHFPEVVTLELFSSMTDAIHAHHNIMIQLGLSEG